MLQKSVGRYVGIVVLSIVLGLAFTAGAQTTSCDQQCRYHISFSYPYPWGYDKIPDGRYLDIIWDYDHIPDSGTYQASGTSVTAHGYRFGIKSCDNVDKDFETTLSEWYFESSRTVDKGKCVHH